MAERTLNIILIGKTGCGKSSTGNFILRKEIFKAKGGFKSTTKTITLEETTQDGITIKVVDTPGLFDTDENVFETALKIQTSLKQVSPGPHVFLLVIDASRKYTEEEKKTQYIIQLTFGEKIFNHAFIVFTHEDGFKSSDKLLSAAQEVQELQDLIELCGGRCITLNTLSTVEHYKKGKLKNIIDGVSTISKNGTVCYTENIAIYTEALKEQIEKKTGIKDLTLELINSVLRQQRELHAQALKKVKDDAKQQSKIAYTDGLATGLSYGLVVGAIGGVGTAVGLVTNAIVKNPEKAMKVLNVGFQLGVRAYEYKRKQYEQERRSDPYGGPMPPDSSEWNRSRQSEDMKVLEGFLSSMKT